MSDRFLGFIGAVICFLVVVFGVFECGRSNGEERGFRWGLCEDQYISNGAAEMLRLRDCKGYKPISDPDRVGEATALSWP